MDEVFVTFWAPSSPLAQDVEDAAIQKHPMTTFPGLASHKKINKAPIYNLKLLVQHAVQPELPALVPTPETSMCGLPQALFGDVGGEGGFIFSCFKAKLGLQS